MTEMTSLFRTEELTLDHVKATEKEESFSCESSDVAAKVSSEGSPNATEDLETSSNDEEEEFMQSLEREEEEAREEWNRNHKTLPQAQEEAPTLLKAALVNGECQDDAVRCAKKRKVEEEMKREEEEKKNEGAEEETEQEEEEDGEAFRKLRNARASQLDFLLCKASEYSNFIASDLEELQNALTKDAEAKAAAASAKKRKRKKEVVHVGNRPIFTQPRNLAPGCILKDYQLEGVRWLTSLYENGVSGILADEMGLGKTIQVISVIAHLRTMEVNGPFLIVAPLATLPNWVREFEKWLPGLAVCRYHGSAPERERLLRGPLHHKHKKSHSFPVIVTNYETAIKDQKKLDRIGAYTYLVVDEGQRLKNHRCTLIASLKRIRASNRLLLSGTPIQNNLDELWSLLNFVNPQIFDDLSVFQSWFGFRDIGQRQKKHYTKENEILAEQRANRTVSKLHEILRPFLLRRIKKEVLKDMPPKKEVVVYAGMSKLQMSYADLIEQGTIRDVLLNQGIERAKNLSQTNKLMNHRKNSNHPFLFGEPIDGITGLHMGTAHPQLLVRASGKFALLDRMLTRLHAEKHQVLIFSQMTEVLNVMEDYLLWRQWRYCRIDGTTDINERQRQMDVFNAEKTGGKDGGRNDADDRHFVFLLSTRAGGLGINLATADTCIIFDSDWNPHQDSQAMDRCHRIGQTRPVAVYRLLTVGSVDIEMMEKQISKKKLERMAIVGGDFRKAGTRSRGKFSSKTLETLLADDIKDLQAKAVDVEDIKINEDEFEAIMDRKRLFGSGDDALPKEGRMYDLIDSGKEVLGAMNG